MKVVEIIALGNNVFKNGWHDSGPSGYLKRSISIAIAWNTETVKFRKLKKWHFEV